MICREESDDLLDLRKRKLVGFEVSRKKRSFFRRFRFEGEGESKKVVGYYYGGVAADKIRDCYNWMAKELNVDAANVAKIFGYQRDKFTAHSGRVTCVRTLYRAGCSEMEIMGTTGHQSASVMRRYNGAGMNLDLVRNVNQKRRAMFKEIGGFLSQEEAQADIDRELDGRRANNQDDLKAEEERVILEASPVPKSMFLFVTFLCC